MSSIEDSRETTSCWFDFHKGKVCLSDAHVANLAMIEVTVPAMQ
jgi:hypothetical protein